MVVGLDVPRGPDVSLYQCFSPSSPALETVYPLSIFCCVFSCWYPFLGYLLKAVDRRIRNRCLVSESETDVSQSREPSGGKGVCTTHEKKSFARFVEISCQERILDPRRLLAPFSLLETISSHGAGGLSVGG